MISRDAQAFVKQREQRLAKGIEIVTEELSLKVGTDDVISSINASSEGISIDAQKININGVISANGGFIVDTDGNMTANNGTFNGVVNATDGVFNGTVYATDGEFTGEINATSGTIDSITATNLTVNSGTFAGSLQAASGTIDNVTATNLTINSGTVDITTGSRDYSAITLSYSTLTLEMSPYEIYMDSGNYNLSARADAITLQDGTSEMGIGAGSISGAYRGTDIWNLTHFTSGSDIYSDFRLYMFPSGSSANRRLGAELNANNGSLYLSNGTNTVTITPSCNIVELSYTVVSTF